MKPNLHAISLLTAFFLATTTLQEIQLTESPPSKPARNFLEVASVKAVQTAEHAAQPAPAIVPRAEKELIALMHSLDKFHFGSSTLFGNQRLEADSTEISLEHFDEIHCCVGKTVYVGAGVSYEELISELRKHKMALENVPESVHANVVSSVINGAHSAHFYGGVLARDVTELAILMPNGQKRFFTPRDVEFSSVLINFGFSGAVIGITLKVVREFTALRCIFQNLLHHDFVRKLHLMFFGKSYSWYFLDPRTMKWEVHHVHRDDKAFRKESKIRSGAPCLARPSNPRMRRRLHQRQSALRDLAGPQLASATPNRSAGQRPVAREDIPVRARSWPGRA